MQADRSAETARLVGSVRGLGVCDALRVELTPAHAPGLRAQLEDRIAAPVRPSPAPPAPWTTPGSAAADHAALAARERRRLETLRAQLPATAEAGFALVGPADLVLDLVAACLADALAPLLPEPARPVAAWPPAPPACLEAAHAWLATALDCRAVESFGAGEAGQGVEAP
jgi:hypothetical protein